MVRHDMQKAKESLKSEQIRLSLGLLTPEEKAAEAKRQAEKADREARESAKGRSLFSDELD